MKLRRIIGCVLCGGILLSTVSGFAMTDWEYNSGMRKAKEYFNKGLYYEAKDELNWFCDSNWGDLTPSQQQDALYYLNTSKDEIYKLENTITKWQFDSGMADGISYYNRGLYYEAYAEIQGFCDKNWFKMSNGQQQNALYYINNSKKKISEWENRSTYTSIKPASRPYMPTYVNNARIGLGVPDNSNITYQTYGEYYWEGGGRYLKPISFFENGEYVAGADIDPYTGEIVKSIYVYMGGICL